MKPIWSVISADGSINFPFDIEASQEQAKLCSFLRSRDYSIEGDALPHVGATRASEA